MRFAVLLLAAGSLVAAPAPNDFRTPDDNTRIVGRWEVVRTIVSGKEVAKPNFDHTIVFRADGACVFEYPNDEKTQFAAWTLDLTESPKRMDRKMRDSAHEFCRRYVFRDGRLVLAWSNGLKSVPLDLAPVPGITVTEYKRANSK
jgi:uncharacterized protein (TIGR03067 family)